MDLYTDIITRYFYIIKRAQKLADKKEVWMKWNCAFFQQAMIGMAWSTYTTSPILNIFVSKQCSIFSKIKIFRMANMPFLCRGVWFSPKLSYHRNGIGKTFQNFLNFYCCWRTVYLSIQLAPDKAWKIVPEKGKNIFINHFSKYVVQTISFGQRPNH